MKVSHDVWFKSDGDLQPQIRKLVQDKVREMCSLPGFIKTDQDDIEQDLIVHLLSKSALYDPTLGSPAAFASRLIENKAASMARKNDAKMRTFRRNEKSLNQAAFDGEGREVQVADTMDASMGRRHTGQRRRSESDLTQLRLDVADANRGLPLPLREVAALLSHVCEFAVSEVLGISRRKTAEHVATLREIYEDRGLVA